MEAFITALEAVFAKHEGSLAPVVSSVVAHVAKQAHDGVQRAVTIPHADILGLAEHLGIKDPAKVDQFATAINGVSEAIANVATTAAMAAI